MGSTAAIWTKMLRAERKGVLVRRVAASDMCKNLL